jgi:PAS domain-containing protein
MGGAKHARVMDKAALATIGSYHRAWTVVLDDTSRIVYEIGTRDQLFGGEPKTSSIGRRIAAFVQPDDIALAVDRMEESLARSRSDISFEIRAGGGDGRWRAVNVRAVNLLDDESVNGIVLAVWAPG